ncbi:hypothetical protein RhiJN_13600 [Ceratobasidium sp. AG-Ba]|nr:hypothetical protein RhiJN_13600 [Ceratobasidium sp. AG-Ba]
MSYFSILSDGTSLPPSSPPAYNATADSPAPPAMDVDSPPPVPISSPSPEWPATPETELDFDHDLNENLAHQNNLDHILSDRNGLAYSLTHAPGPPSGVATCPGCGKTRTILCVIKHRRDHCGALASDISNQVITCRGCGKPVTRWRARKHRYTGCTEEMRTERWHDPQFRFRYYLWLNYLYSVDRF